MQVFRKGLIWKLPLVLLGVWTLAVFVTARPGNRALYPAYGETVTIYVLNNGFHSDIVLPADRVMARGGVLAEAGKAGGGRKWLVYGWGDKGFYTATGMSFARMADGLRALFRPGNPSVIRVYGVEATPDRAFVEPIASYCYFRGGLCRLGTKPRGIVRQSGWQARGGGYRKTGRYVLYQS